MAIIITDITNPFFAILPAVSRRFEQKGFLVLYVIATGIFSREIRFLEMNCKNNGWMCLVLNPAKVKVED